MFTIVKLRQVISKTSKTVFNLSKRGYLPKKSKTPALVEQLQLKPPTFSNIQRSGLTPEGYTVIYVSPIYKQLNFGHALLAGSWPLVLYYFYVNLKEPQWYKKKISFFHSSKGSLGLMLLAVPLVLHWFLLRNVRVIFKKNDQFKTLIYGLFGPLRKIYVEHGKYSYERSPKSNLFHYLKNRRVIIFRENFTDELDYYRLIFTQNRDQSYL